jgi:hypothetical protein
MTQTGPRYAIQMAEALKILKVSRKTALRMIDKGELQAIRRRPGPRGAYLFDEDHVRQVAARRAEAALAEAEALAEAAGVGLVEANATTPGGGPA